MPTIVSRAARTSSVLLSLGLILVACSNERGFQNSPGVLTTIESIRLDESEASFVGEATGFAVMEDGSFVVSDRRNAMLHHFAASGLRLEGVGRRGKGPNEWVMGPTIAVAGAGSTVFVGDGPFIRAVDVDAGRFSWSRARSTKAIATASRADSLLLVELDPSSGRSLHLVANAGDSMRSGGPVPQLAASNPIVAGYFSHPAAAFVAGDTVALVLQSADFVFFGPFRGGAYDSLALVPLARRGALSADLQRINPANPTAAQALMYRPSYPQLVSSIASNRYVATVFADLEMVSGRMTGRLYLQVLDLRARRVCREEPIDVPRDPLPYVALARDTLYVLTQRSDENVASITEVRRYLLNPEACQWLSADER